MSEKKKSKSKKKNITINIPSQYDKKIQELIKKKVVASRSDAVRTALREYLEREFGENLELLDFEDRHVEL